MPWIYSLTESPLCSFLTGAVLTFLVTTYSRRYLHREEGYKRFFYTILLFFSDTTLPFCQGILRRFLSAGRSLVSTSFLLISFYRDRYLPVKNAVKVFSVYRLADVSILLAVWASHHLWSTYIAFEKISDYQLVHRQLQAHELIGTTLFRHDSPCCGRQIGPIAIFVLASPRNGRAYSSTAIFYGALSVNMGVFLLPRTWPFWQHQPGIRLLIGAIGLSTSLVATGIARVQSSVKSQIAYASISQIGLIFVEIAAGLETLRCYILQEMLFEGYSTVNIPFHSEPEDRSVSRGPKNPLLSVLKGLFPSAPVDRLIYAQSRKEWDP